MAYDRYDTRDEPRGGRERWRDERYQGGGRDDQDRGFFERMGDEVRSWFGDEDEDRGRREHRMSGERERGYGRSGGFGGGRDRDEDRGRPQERFGGRRSWASSGRDYNPSQRDMWRGDAGEEDTGRFWRDRTWGGGDYEGEEDNSRSSRRGESEGGAHRSEGFFAASGGGRGGTDRDDRSGYGRSQTPYGRDEYRQTSYAGSAKGSRDFDPHYHSWRERQMSELDRDYHDYRRERQSRFEDDFGNWRERRLQKRALLGQIREHMEVVGSDGERVGTIDRVAGDRLILTKSDPESRGVHHSLSCSEIDRVEGDQVILETSADQARERWRDESRSRALFEREDQGEMGPHVLDRSFEGTYR